MSKKKVLCDGNSCRLVSDTVEEDKIPIKKSLKPLPSVNKNDEWTVYGAEWCPYCVKAKALLVEKKLAHIYHDVTEYSNARDSLKEWTDGYKTIPVVFNKNKFVGGYTDLVKKL